MSRSLIRLLVLGALVMASGCASTGSGWTARPTVPSSIAPPEGATLQAHVHAEGTQNYTCTANGEAFGWSAGVPDAKLYDASGSQVGTHQAGPSWTSGGGTVTAAKIQMADGGAGNVPWLLLKVSTPATTGPFANVTFIQRVGTKGGVTPAADACNAGTATNKVGVPYSADYYFFK